MSKFIRVFTILLIACSIFFNFYSVYATDLDSEVPPGGAGTDASDTNEIANEILNSIDNETLTDTGALDDEVPQTGDSSSITNPTSVGATSEEGLTFSNILNILLITVGVILILLSIAIIIRLN